jgi:amidase
MTTSTLSGLLQRPAIEQAALVRSGEVSAAELVEASLAAIGRSELNAFVTVCGERALAAAAEVRPGDPRPLCGVPVAIKDLGYAVEGVPVTHGSAAFGDWVPGHDAPHVRGLKEAGAIVVGRTATPELGLRPVTESLRHGVTRNPRDPELMSGGSSGGSAAAVGGGLVGLADGSDMGGSIRIPAACCGVVGLKPGRGVVDNGPDVGDALGEMMTAGALTRTVRDAAAALDAMTAQDAYAAAAERPPGRVTVRVARRAPNGVPVDPEPRAAVSRAAGLLADLGHDVEEHTPAWDDDRFARAWNTAGMAAVRYMIRRLARAEGREADLTKLEPANRAWIADGPPVEGADLFEAMDDLRAYARRILTGWDAGTVLLCPTLTRLPARLGELRQQTGVTDDAVRFSALVRIWNVTGQPAISLPIGDGAVQLVAAPGREDLLLPLAAQLEGAAR